MPNVESFFGKYGGQFVPEGIHFPLEKLRREYLDFVESKNFHKEFKELYNQLAIPKPSLHSLQKLSHNKNLCLVYNYGSFYNAIGQSLLAKKSGKSEVIYAATTDSHTMATALSCNRLEIPLKIFLDTSCLSENTLDFLSGFSSEIIYTDEKPYRVPALYAFQSWLSDPTGKYLLLEEAIGPAYFPSITRNFFSLFGEEIKSLFVENFGKVPDLIVSPYNGTSTLGVSYPCLEEKTEIVIVRTNKEENKETTEILGGITTVINPGFESQEIIPPELSHLLEKGRIKRVPVEGGINELSRELAEKEGMVLTNTNSYYALTYGLQKIAEEKSVLVLTEKPAWVVDYEPYR